MHRLLLILLPTALLWIGDLSFAGMLEDADAANKRGDYVNWTVLLSPTPPPR